MADVSNSGDNSKNLNLNMNARNTRSGIGKNGRGMNGKKFTPPLFLSTIDELKSSRGSGMNNGGMNSGGKNSSANSSAINCNDKNSSDKNSGGNNSNNKHNSETKPSDTNGSTTNSSGTSSSGTNSSNKNSRSMDVNDVDGGINDNNSDCKEFQSTSKLRNKSKYVNHRDMVFVYSCEPNKNGGIRQCKGNSVFMCQICKVFGKADFENKDLNAVIGNVQSRVDKETKNHKMNGQARPRPVYLDRTYYNIYFKSKKIDKSSKNRSIKNSK